MTTLDGLTKQKNYLVSSMNNEISKATPNVELVAKLAVHAAQNELEIVKVLIEQKKTDEAIINIVSLVSCLQEALPKKAKADLREVLSKVFQDH